MNRKVKVSLNIDRDMLERARQKDIDLDELFEHALRRYGCEDPEKAAARTKAWREVNRLAIEQSNRHIEKHGLWWEAFARPRKKKPAQRKTMKNP